MFGELEGSIFEAMFGKPERKKRMIARKKISSKGESLKKVSFYAKTKSGRKKKVTFFC